MQNSWNKCEQLPSSHPRWLTAAFRQITRPLFLDLCCNVLFPLAIRCNDPTSIMSHRIQLRLAFSHKLCNHSSLRRNRLVKEERRVWSRCSNWSYLSWNCVLLCQILLEEESSLTVLRFQLRTTNIVYIEWLLASEGERSHWSTIERCSSKPINMMNWQLSRWWALIWTGSPSASNHLMKCGRERSR